MSSSAQSPPVEIDPTEPSSARVYDALIGGKNHYEADRRVLSQILEIAPEAQSLGREHRAWLVRVTRYLVNQGIDQFLDLASGLPTTESTHNVVQRSDPDSRVVYVDNDPVVAAHNRALVEDERTRVVDVDLVESEKLFNHPRVTDTLEFDRPMALILCATLQYVDDLTTAQRVMKRYVDQLPSGSFVALTHQYDPADGGACSKLAVRLQEHLREMLGTGTYRTWDEILSFFDGLELLEPGLDYLHQWWPDGPLNVPSSPVHYTVLGGLARKL